MAKATDTKPIVIVGGGKGGGTVPAPAQAGLRVDHAGPDTPGPVADPSLPQHSLTQAQGQAGH